MNKQDKDELLNQGLTQKEIEDLTQKGFSKEEIIQSHQYDNEIKKGSTFIAWIVDLITWFHLKQQRLSNHCCSLFRFLFKYIF